MIDVGCGTGYFTRRFAMDGIRVTGIDPDPAMLYFAQSHSVAGESYSIADARSIPFPDDEFDLCIAVTSLCFVQEQTAALAEMVRVSRGRIALGLLNRHSLLYWQKGRRGGTGAYRGAYWHTVEEARALFAGLPVKNIRVGSALHLPHASGWSRQLDSWLEGSFLFGGFLVVAAEIVS